MNWPESRERERNVCSIFVEMFCLYSQILIDKKHVFLPVDSKCAKVIPWIQEETVVVTKHDDRVESFMIERFYH